MLISNKYWLPPVCAVAIRLTDSLKKEIDATAKRLIGGWVAEKMAEHGYVPDGFRRISKIKWFFGQGALYRSRLHPRGSHPLLEHLSPDDE